MPPGLGQASLVGRKVGGEDLVDPLEMMCRDVRAARKTEAGGLPQSQSCVDETGGLDLESGGEK